MHYAEIVREKFLLRQLIAASNDILRDAYAPHEQADIIRRQAPRSGSSRSRRRRIGGSMQPLEDVLHEVFEMIENSGQRGLETGFFELDDMLNGLQNGEMIIVAARPSMGKTAFAMNLIETSPPTSGMPVRGVLAGNEQAAARAAHAVLRAGRSTRTSCAGGCCQAHEYQHLANVVGAAGQGADLGG